MSREQKVWLKLSKMAEAEGLSQEALRTLEELASRHSNEESAGKEPHRCTPLTIDNPEELMNWLRDNPGTGSRKVKGWREKSRNDFDMTSDALCRLAEGGEWLSVRWTESLQSWLAEDIRQKSWDKLAPVFVKAPDEELRSISRDVSWWLKIHAKKFKGNEEHILTLAERILALEHWGDAGPAQTVKFDSEDEDINREKDIFREANSHPVGNAARALVLWWLGQSLQDDEGLRDKIRPTFTKLCDAQIKEYRPARVWLAAHIITLFRVDTDWTKSHLLPLFSWDQFPNEAPVVWAGFLSSPRLYSPLMKAIQHEILDAANHYDDLGKNGGKYADFLTFAALDSDGPITKTQFRKATCALPPQGLNEAAMTLMRTMQSFWGSGAQYWASRMVPYLKRVWPKYSEDFKSEDFAPVSANLARLCLETRGDFPEALKLLSPWLRHLEDVSYLINILHKLGLCEQYPEQSLELLHRIIGGKTKRLESSDLGVCLETIKQADHQLENDPRFARLTALSRQQSDS